MKKRNTISKSKCKFPFKYKGKLYNDCLDTGNGPWCPISLTKRNYTKKKAYCKKKSRKSRKSKTKKLLNNLVKRNKNSNTKKQLNNLLKRNKNKKLLTNLSIRNKSKYVSNDILEPVTIPKKPLYLSRFLYNFF